MRCLGLDTSNYTTSVAVFGNDGIAQNTGRLLDVPKGALGLRQSEAVFQHVRRLPELIAALCEEGVLDGLSAIGVSSRPREAENSYMPCFLVGEGQGKSLASVLRVPFFSFSHQQGHIAAAAWSAGQLILLDKPFLAWHLSGGTTELLFVEPKEGIPTARKIGGTSDISAGQLIDRTGQALGLDFPSGKAVDRLSRACEQETHFTVKLNGLFFSLSGMENQMRCVLQNGSPSATARFVLETLVSVLVRATEAARQDYGPLSVLFSGGVASNSLLREKLAGPDILFAQPEFSTDNALGPAILACRRLESLSEYRKRNKPQAAQGKEEPV